MTKAETKKVWQVVGTIVVVAVVATAVQWGRFWSKTKDIVNGTTIVFPTNYFPFNGSYTMANDKLTKNK